MTTKKIYGLWIKWHGGEWHGGECPVPPDTVVEVMRRSGAVLGPGRAAGFLWYHDGDSADIVEYRIVSEQPDLDAAEQPDLDAAEQPDLDAAEQLLLAHSYTVIPPAKPLTFEDVTPMTEAPPEGTEYWVVSAGEREGVYIAYFYGRDIDHRIIKRRMAYLEKEHALVAAKHVFGLKGGEL